MTTESMKPYPAYKDSGIEWIGEIPEGWRFTKLKRLFKIVNGATPKSNIQNYWGDDILWVTPEDLGKLQSNTIADTGRKITDEGYKSCGTTIVPANSLVLSTRAPIGHLAITGVSLCSNQGCKCLVNTSVSNNHYFYYHLLAARSELVSLGQGSTFQELSKNNLEDVELLSPTYEEQQSIATFLDNQTSKIDTLIENKQKQIELLKEERTAIINQAVTKGLNPDVPMRDSGIEWLGEIPEHWGAKKLKYLVKNINYKINSKSSDLKIALENIESFTGNLRNLNIEDVFESEGKEFINGDVLFNKLRPYLAKVYRAESRGLCVSELLVLRPNEKILSDFLYYRCLSTDFINEVNSSTYGSKMPRASWDFIENLLIPFTTETEQGFITKYIESEITKANNTISQIQQQITLLQEYRTALISEAVTGKIDLRNQHEFPTPK